MNVYLFKQYDKFAPGRHAFERHVGLALCRNQNAYGCPGSEQSMRTAEKAKIANKTQLEVWAKGLGLDHKGTVEELKERILEFVKGG